MDETEIRSFFARYGSVKEVKIITDRTGVSKGYVNILAIATVYRTKHAGETPDIRQDSKWAFILTLMNFLLLIIYFMDKRFFNQFFYLVIFLVFVF